MIGTSRVGRADAVVDGTVLTASVSIRVNKRSVGSLG